MAQDELRVQQAEPDRLIRNYGRVHPEDRPKVRAALSRLVDGGSEERVAVTLLGSADGSAVEIRTASAIAKLAALPR